jgi:hypothetical protein
MVEYALFLSLIAGGLVLASDAVAFAMRNSMLQASASLQGADFTRSWQGHRQVLRERTPQWHVR